MCILHNIADRFIDFVNSKYEEIWNEPITNEYDIKGDS